MQNTAVNKKPGKKQLFIIIALAAMLIVALAVTIILITTNSDKGGEENGEVYTVSEFGTVQGKFTDIVIEDEDSAIAAVRDAARILGLTNAVEELTNKRTDTVDDLVYYRINQNYKGIPVYGGSFVVVADENGEALCLSSHAKNIDEDISLVPTATEEQIIAAISAEFEDNENIEIPEITEDMLVIYNSDDEKPAELSYELYITVNGSNYRTIVSALDGECLFSATLDYSNAVDEERNIIVCNANHTVFECDEKLCEANIVVLNDNTKKANQLFEYLQFTYDYFEDTFKIKGFNNKNGKTYAILNCLFEREEDGQTVIYSNNAFSNTNFFKSKTFLRFGSSEIISIDLVSHEYMHSVEQATVGMHSQGESGAIMEAYSDLFGELIEDKYVKIADKSKHCDWIHGTGDTARNIYNPIETLQPSSTFMQQDTASDYDNGFVHHNSTIISHTAYIMTQTKYGFTALTTDDLTKLWWNTLLLITNKNCTFAELRNYMESAAINIGLSTEKKARVVSAFDLANILPKEEKVPKDFEIYLISRNNHEIYKNCRVLINGVATAWVDENINLTIDLTGESTTVHLEKGKYTIEVYNDNTGDLLFTRDISVNNKYDDEYVLFLIEDLEDQSEETTVIPETTATPETTEHIHDYAETQKVEPTCTKEGSIKYACVCGETTVSSIPVTGHTFENNICSVCGFSLSKASNGLEIKKYTSYCEIVGIGSCKDEHIVLPDTYLGLPVTKLSDEVFKDCEFIKSVYIPASIIEITGSMITNSPFRNCKALESIEVDPENPVMHSAGNCLIVTERKLLIAGCKNSVIPDDGSVKTIGNTAFYGTEIKSLVIPDTITNVGMFAFNNCNSLNLLYLPASSMQYLNAPIFLNRFKTCPLHEVIIGNDFTDMSRLDFETLQSLSSITLGNGITTICTNDFNKLPSLTTVNLKKSIKKIEKNAFNNCDSLVTIKYEGTVAEWNAIEKEAGWDNGSDNYTVYCTDGEIKK